MHILHPWDIEDFLRLDFLKSGVRPNMCTLSTLTIEIDLDQCGCFRVPIDLATLPEDFAPLLRLGQLSTQTQLHIKFIISLHISFDGFWDNPDAYVPVLHDQMSFLENTLKSLKPVVNQLRAICHKGWVRATISLGRYGGQDVRIFTENTWAAGYFGKRAREIDWAGQDARYWTEEVAKTMRAMVEIQNVALDGW